MNHILPLVQSQIRQKRHQTLVILFFIFTLALTSMSFAEGFEVKGILKVNNRQVESFDVSVSGCKWFIVTSPYPDPNRGDITRWEIGSEGNGEMCQVSLFNKTTLSPASINDSIGLIKSGNVPDNIQENQVSELWLAFASGCYFNGVTNGMLEPVYSHSAQMPPDHLDHSAYERFDLGPELPKYVIYTNDTLLAVSKGKPISIPLPSQFENGFVRAEYKVIFSTNVGNMTLPTDFIFMENGIIPVREKGSPSALQIRNSIRIVEGVVTEVLPKCDRTRFIPDLTRNTYIDDRRFNNKEKPVASLSYMATNGVWPPVTADFLQKLYNHELIVRAHMISADVKPDHESGVEQKPGAMTVVRIVLALAFLVPLLIIVIITLKQKNERKKGIQNEKEH